VVALSDNVVLRERPRLALASCYLDPAKGDEVPDSHPGACAVADVLEKDGRVRFTAVGLYAQWEVMADGKTMEACARLHRMLSDLSTIFLAPPRRPVILAGDLNITTQWSRPATVKANVDAAFARIRAMNLVDCIAHTRGERERLASCGCLEGDGCFHVQTFRANNRAASGPTQLDYAFVSKSAISSLTKCEVVQTDEAWQLSDHCPIVLDIDALRLAAG
jgi:endonuclease/exonuclease/phosphatase family metal-dependent hydrolase